jgi:hypothetical protein
VVETGSGDGLSMTAPHEEKSKKRWRGGDKRLQRRIDELEELAVRSLRWGPP